MPTDESETGISCMRVCCMCDHAAGCHKPEIQIDSGPVRPDNLWPRRSELTQTARPKRTACTRRLVVVITDAYGWLVAWAL